jgi:hypothetical protein
MKNGKNRKYGGLGALFLFLILAFNGQVLIGCGSEGGTEPETDPDAEIVILYPTGGERLEVGDTLRVRWRTQGKGIEEIDAVNIELSPDSGATWLTILTRSIAPGDSTWGNHPWQIQSVLSRLNTTYPLVGNDKILLKIKKYTTSEKNKIVIIKKPFRIVAKAQP